MEDGQELPSMNWNLHNEPISRRTQFAAGSIKTYALPSMILPLLRYTYASAGTERVFDMNNSGQLLKLANYGPASP